jgi:hypothetical protein
MHGLPALLVIAAAAASILAPAAAVAAPCADRLDAVRPSSAAPGEEIELLGRFATERGARRPAVNREGFNDLEVLEWAPGRVRARLPGRLLPGIHKVGIYCDGRPGPDRFLHSTTWLDLDVSAARAPAPAPAHAGSRSLPTRGDFEAWLLAHPRLADEIVWEDLDGPELYRRWPEPRKAALYEAFRRSFAGAADQATEPPPNLAAGDPGDALRQVLATADAEELFLDSVGHSLALEMGGRVPWSVLAYPLAELEILFDSRRFFVRRAEGYEIEFGESGMALPSPTARAWRFLGPRVGATRRETIVAALDWLGEHAVHFEGTASVATMREQWQYPGYPPVSRVLDGTPHLGRPGWPVRPRSAGCYGAAGFLRALLRAANIPVAMASSCGHFQVQFPTEGLFLSHGDDPYNGDFRARGCSADVLLLEEPVFRTWFRSGPEATRCANIGRGAREAVCR